MIGAIYGDIMGSTYEFDNISIKNFVLPDDSEFTDDSVMAVAIATALMDNEKYAPVLKSWCRQYPNPMGGYGANFSQWIVSRWDRPYGSWGNGALTRMMGIPWLRLRSPEDMSIQVKKATEITHNAPEALERVQFIAEIMGEAIRNKGTKPKNIIKSYEKAYGRCRTVEKQKVQPYSESCMEALDAAMVAIKYGEGFEDTVRLAVSFGGDSDSIAAVAGGIAETIYQDERDYIREFIEPYLDDNMRRSVNRFIEITSHELEAFRYRQAH